MEYNESFMNSFDPSLQTTIDAIQNEERKKQAKYKLFELYSSVKDAGLMPEDAENITVPELTDSVIRLNMIEGTTRAKNITGKDVLRAFNKDCEQKIYGELNGLLPVDAPDTIGHRFNTRFNKYDIMLGDGTYNDTIRILENDIRINKALIGTDDEKEPCERICDACKQAADAVFTSKTEEKKKIATLALTDEYLKQYANDVNLNSVAYNDYMQNKSNNPEASHRIEDKIVDMKKDCLTDSMSHAKSDLIEFSSLVGDETIDTQIKNSFTDNTLTKRMAANIHETAEKGGRKSMTAVICSDKKLDTRDMLMMCLDDKGNPYVCECRLRGVENDPRNSLNYLERNDNKPTRDESVMYFDVLDEYGRITGDMKTATAGHMNLTVFPRTPEGARDLVNACRAYNENPDTFFDEMDKLADPKKRGYETAYTSAHMTYNIKQDEAGKSITSASFSPQSGDSATVQMVDYLKVMTGQIDQRDGMAVIYPDGNISSAVKKIPPVAFHSSVSFKHDPPEVQNRAKLMASFLGCTESDLAKDIYATPIVAQTEIAPPYELKSTAEFRRMDTAVQDIAKCGAMADMINTIKDEPVQNFNPTAAACMEESPEIIAKGTELFTARTYADFAVALQSVIPDKLSLSSAEEVHNGAYAIKCNMSETEKAAFAAAWENMAFLEPQPDNMKKLEASIGPEAMRSGFLLFAEHKLKENAREDFLTKEVESIVSEQHKQVVAEHTEQLMNSISATTANIVATKTGIPAKDLMPELSTAIRGASINPPNENTPSINTCMANLINTETAVIENTCQALCIKNPHVSQGNLAITAVTEGVMKDLHSGKPSEFVTELAARAEKNYEQNGDEHIAECMEKLYLEMSPTNNNKGQYADYTKRFTDKPSLGYAMFAPQQDLFETKINPEARKLEIERMTEKINESIKQNMNVEVTGEKTLLEKFGDKVRKLTDKNAEETYGKNQKVNISINDKSSKLKALETINEISNKYERSQQSKEDTDLSK